MKNISDNIDDTFYKKIRYFMYKQVVLHTQENVTENMINLLIMSNPILKFPDTELKSNIKYGKH